MDFWFTLGSLVPLNAFKGLRVTAFRGGNPRRIIQLAVSEQIVLYSSKLMVDELQVTLAYPKLQRRLEKLAITAEELLVEVAAITQLSQPAPIPDVSQLRDPKDKIVLETALGVPVEVIISGDEDLLILREFQQIPILTTKQFLETYHFADT